jgi:hypothetical protein
LGTRSENTVHLVLIRLGFSPMASLTSCGPAYCKHLNNAPVIRGIQFNMDRKLAPPVVALEKMPDGVFIHFADGRFAFYSYDLLYATIETAQIVSPEMNEHNRYIP